MKDFNMSSDIPDDSKQQIAEAIFAERKIEAIKLYRDATGQGLAEAKEFIEKLTDELREKSPERFKPLSSGSADGCGSSALIFLAVIGALAVCATTFIG
ncbi:MAG: ribosomal protein L7/L12 [Planctomycetes bacterium]|nr:ribosomal protein L7/L12 [Planctomycetota bacterium]